MEAAFRAHNTPLEERPIFPQLAHRTQTHLFLCVLAYHLLVCIEQRFLERGTHPLVVDPAPAIKRPPARHGGPSRQQWRGP